MDQPWEAFDRARRVLRGRDDLVGWKSADLPSVVRLLLQHPLFSSLFSGETPYFVDFLNFASDFAPDCGPDQLSDSGKLASFQNGAPNTLCFP